MRATQWFIATLKETPNDAEVISHQYMLRSGMIKKLGAGLYTWMPLGLKVLRKVEAIVREEMSRAGSIELLMPAVQPAELWKETGRWDTFGGQLLSMTDASNREYCFGPTHEEVITDICRQELKSYKQLPINFYQIQTKFRDEIRPRFGVMRAREFLMKDAYSFHLNQESLNQSYQAMYDAYSRIFDRLGLRYRAVEADTGAIGGSMSHEFQVLAEAGEDLIFYSDASNYAANVEQASSLPPKKGGIAAESMQILDTPGQKTIEEVSSFLKVPASKMLKTLIVRGKEVPLVALVLKGDDDLNEIKAAKHPLVHKPLVFVDEEEILKSIKAPIGSIGPIDLKIPVIADHEALALSAFVCGANQKDKHCIHVSWGLQAQYDEAADLRNVKEGDLSPDGKGVLRSCRGIEVGHVFQLGTKYSKAMNASVLNEAGQLSTLTMGTYGLGISRVVAAAIEQHHDAAGIIWPQALAPFDLVLIPMNAQRSDFVAQTTEDLYQSLCQQGFDVLLDDRHERPGFLFADHDLIGIPHRFILGEKNLNEGLIEYKNRASGDTELLPLNKVQAFIKRLLRK